MPLSADWTTKVITVPQSELSLIVGTRYNITVDHWFTLLRELNATLQGIVETVNSSLYANTSPTTTTPRIVDVINGYTVQFEDGLYSVEFVDGNTNIREVEIKNLVSVGSNNTSALINPAVLEASVYAGRVVVDGIDGVSGTGKTPDGRLIGTFAAPSSNMLDALQIAIDENVRDFLFLHDMTVTLDFSLGYNMKGSSPFNVLTASSIADLTGVSLELLTVQGELDGLNVIRSCSLRAITDVSGFIERCALYSTVHLNGPVLIMDCYSNVAGSGYPAIHAAAGSTIEVRDFHGSIGIDEVVDSSHSIGGSGGRCTIEAGCIGGTIHVRGNWFEIVDNSGPGCTVLDERFAGGLTSTESIHLLSLPTATEQTIDILDSIP